MIYQEPRTSFFKTQKTLAVRISCHFPCDTRFHQLQLPVHGLAFPTTRRAPLARDPLRTPQTPF